ncbi:MAG: aminodeoxychorismate/anthranilate synthase component II [Nitrospirae bacterium]|nr:aminodeoxychorismate/anthranilate synthase component II [Nitrospirota bacterium]
MIVMIDNYDSFTYNLVQYLGELGQEIRVFRNDKVTIPEIAALGPDHIVVSPGPCDPSQAGISKEVIAHFAGRVPILGVCLGHQAIGEVFGGRVVRAERLMHGKTSMIRHDGRGVFKGLESPFEATRYHSLIVEAESLPGCLVETAWTESGELMGVRHKEFQVHGVQFHPESILTRVGHDLLRNFVAMREAVRA